MRVFFLSAVLCVSLLFSCGNDRGNRQVIAEGIVPAAASIGFVVVGQLPHDTAAFTEGLLFHEGRLYESTGYVEQVPGSHSWFGPVDSVKGVIHSVAELDKHRYFGEGICFLRDRVYQLTYREKVGFIYDAKTFKKLGEFSLPGREGWGMTTDGRSLLVSDGTSTIYYLDPVSMQTTRKLQVTDGGVPPDSLNELEYIRGYIYANRYTKNYILKIDPATGQAVGKLDCGNLAAAAEQAYAGSKEFNGIAYDSVTDRIYVTGKCWPWIYSIRFAH